MLFFNSPSSLYTPVNVTLSSALTEVPIEKLNNDFVLI